eukprot:GHVS01040729.1.p1 GENE.GHVS01040729.1~~GHVS01040729.1.p1  ORF type:complete len:171 (-),score=22.56 GHVS01040729.1:231-743(-)
MVERSKQEIVEEDKVEEVSFAVKLISDCCAGVYNWTAVRRTTALLNNTELDPGLTGYIQSRSQTFPIAALCVTAGIHLLGSKFLTSSFKRFFFYRPSLPGLIATLPALGYFGVHLGNHRRLLLGDLLFNQQLEESASAQTLEIIHNIRNMYLESAPTDYARLQTLHRQIG